MAWRSSGANNTELVDNLKRNGLIHSKQVELAFRLCDRRLFLPRELDADVVQNVYVDMPIRVGCIHQSAAHMYAHILEYLDLQPGQTFLCVGSGSGWLQNMVASIVGESGMCY